jgi:hypothetical protein
VTCTNAKEAPLTTAIVFVRSDDFDPHATRCTIYAQEQGYELAGVIVDDWDAVTRMLHDGDAGVAIVSTEEHLPPKRTPRVEVVANATGSRWERRTRVIRKIWEA